VIHQRCSGILLHIISLPSEHGIGDLGAAEDFIEFLSRTGQTIWQVLPVGPTGYADSPYQCFSAFAGNPLLVNLFDLLEQGLLDQSDLNSAPGLPNGSIDYERVIAFKKPLLRKAAQRFLKNNDRPVFKSFCKSNASWLDDYALFMAAKDFYGGSVWTEWDSGLRTRDRVSLGEWNQKLLPEIEAYQFEQFEFFRQWAKLKDRCRRHNIRIMGDIPIYVAHDSADVWSHPEMFLLDEHGKPTVVAGVPPDYFSATGQLWGNPIYRWDVLEHSGYQWWIDRLSSSFELFDLVRLDHFRGFEAYWEVPAGASTAIGGKWVKGPGRKLFEILRNKLGDLPIIAENLGVITPEVEAIQHEFGFPGMSILQFAFGNDPQGPSFRPHNYSRELAAYTGVHDNDTTVGWWTSTGIGESTRTAEDIRKEHEFAKAYLGFENEPINWVLIRDVLASVAVIAIVPLQDILGLGSEARMNLPGTVSGNWKWRYRRGALTAEMESRLKMFTQIYDR
jgi:4-alpha-glucanotransferase